MKVVHRDIKPHNLFLAQRDAGEVIVKLLDFGIAKVKMDEASKTEGADLTKTGNLLGSPLYMSPEQARGRKDIDHRTDVWSLGAVLYQALCGKTPYEHAETLGDLIFALCSEPPPPVQDDAQWVPPEIAEVAHRCLRIDPAERYQTATEMFEAVSELLPNGYGIHEDMLVSLEDSQRRETAPRLPMSVPPAGKPISDRPSATPITDGSITKAALARTEPQASTPPPAKKTVTVVGAFLAAAVVGGGIWYFAQGGDAPTQPAPQKSAPARTVASAAPTTAPTTASTVVKTATPAPAAKEKRVRVVVIPDDAKVEVEGKPTKIKNGILEIEGIAGSVHRVRVFKGKSETTADVVVTEAGALPPKIELQIGRVVRLPRPGTSGMPGPTSPTSPTKPAVPTGIKTHTNEFD